jgi:tight adherence protein B
VLRYRHQDSPKPASRTTLPPSPTVVAQRALDMADQALRSRGRRTDVVSELEGAGLRMRPEEWAIVHLSICAATAAGLYLVGGSLWWIPVGAVLGWFGGRTYLRLRRSRRETAFQTQIPETLQLVAGSLQAGFSLGQSLTTVVREGTEPTASEFSRALTEAKLGASLEDALDGVAERMRCQDLEWVVMAIRVSREVGGNLAEVIQTTVVTMRARAELRGLVRTLSAEGRLSAWVLEALPFGIAGYLLLTKPDYLAPLVHSGLGWAMLAAGVSMLAMGMFWISRLVKVEM